MFALYITHPEIRIDPLVPVPDWSLSDKGRARAEAAAGCDWVSRIGRIISSDERKAVETAGILAKASGAEVEVIAAAGENDRSATGFLSPDLFEIAANRFFAHPEESYQGWERAIDAQSRIVAVIDQVLASHDPVVPVAFVGHGGVGTLFKCHLGGFPIARCHDQPGGGGNLFAFRLADRSLACDWSPIETWEGLPEWTQGSA